ncbi:hypothetical protein J15TS10_37390 [Paenibacillus woosongensis]|uniref:Uncharacterized protein n=1 Tax=Paenibacillus woosongensis TaxID=307580 RepID=A0ABQ4MVH2_9BACL|nr:hypothetical protein J15TS10_37390 [Paenibacillus woosongensis]
MFLGYECFLNEKEGEGMEDSNVKIAINGGIGFGSKLNAKQLAVITKYMHEMTN